MVERIEGSEPQQYLNSPAGRMRWNVLWYNPKKDKIIKVPCGNDLTEALRIYEKAKQGEKVRPTLHCSNTGFPPPEKFQPHFVRVSKIVTVSVRGRQKKVRRWETQARTPMNAANRKGIYWCPYCREFRKFQMQSGFHIDGRWVPDPDARGGLYCPMCGISHRDFHVRRWNPIADRHYLTGGRTSRGTNRSNGRATNRRRAQA